MASLSRGNKRAIRLPMLVVEIALLAWTVAALVWWCIAFSLLRGTSCQMLAVPAEPLPVVTLFKTLPPTAAAEDRLRLAEAIESFIAQLEPGTHMIIGVEEPELPGWEPIFERWRRSPAASQLSIQSVTPPPPSANPKIAKIEALAPQARGEYWLWSDADIVAPAGLLRQLQQELTGPATRAVTCAYLIRSPERLPGMLDALFVNLEFLPGALLLGRKGPQDFTFGAVVLFRASDFHARTSWSELRSALADDFELGRRLEQVRLSGCLVETLALCGRWRPALAHYYRWQKTIRWCRPGGYVALLAILPFLGWLAAVLARPSVGWLWAGLGWVWFSEALFAGVAFATLGCKLPAKGWLLLLAWPPLRAFTWLAVWLPISVGWGAGRDRWRKAHRKGAFRKGE